MLGPWKRSGRFAFQKHAPLGRYKIGIKETIHSPCQPITI